MANNKVKIVVGFPAASGDGIPEAPNDGNQYGRQNETWTPIVGGGSGVQSVTGDGVGGTATNPVLSFPNPSDIGLDNVDNTSDLDKPISNATLSALNDKASDADLTTLGSEVSINTQNIGLIDSRVTTNEGDIQTLQNNQVNPNNFVNKVTSTTQDMTGRLTVQTPVDSNTSDAASVGYVLSKTNDKVSSNTTGEPTGADVVFNVVSLTQAEYDAGTPIATTFYLITDA